MKPKTWINKAVGLSGYQFVRRPSLARDLRSGKYRWLQQRGIATVLDIGANTGQFAAFIREVLPDAMIYSFEPLEECYRELTARAAELMPMTCFPFALGRSEATVAMNKNEFSPSSSMLDMHAKHVEAFPYTAHSAVEMVQVRRLDSVLPEMVLKPRVLAKIDVQGYEMHVLEGAGESLNGIDVLIVETSFETLYEHQPLFDDVYGFLTGRHFTYMGNLDQMTDPSSGSVLQADAIFVRRQAGC